MYNGIEMETQLMIILFGEDLLIFVSSLTLWHLNKAFSFIHSFIHLTYKGQQYSWFGESPITMVTTFYPAVLRYNTL